MNPEQSSKERTPEGFEIICALTPEVWEWCALMDREAERLESEAKTQGHNLSRDELSRLAFHAAKEKAPDLYQAVQEQDKRLNRRPNTL